MGVWIGDLWISPRTAEKIQSKHGLSIEEVSEAVVRVAALPYRWHDHPERGRRLLLDVMIRDSLVRVVLYPRPWDAYGDSWDLGSAYPLGR